MGNGSMIRHSCRCQLRQPLPLHIVALPRAMIGLAFRAGLITAVGSALLQAPGLVIAFGAAIAMPSIAVRTEEEHRLTWLPAARSLNKNSPRMSGRLHSSQRTDSTAAALCVSGICCWLYLARSTDAGNPTALTEGFPFSRPVVTIPVRLRRWDDGTPRRDDVHPRTPTPQTPILTPVSHTQLGLPYSQRLEMSALTATSPAIGW